jgi:hypothetical protein
MYCWKLALQHTVHIFTTHMSQPTLVPTSTETEGPSINLQSSTPPEGAARGDSSGTLVSLIRKEYHRLTQLLPELDLTRKDRETRSSKLERYAGSLGPHTDEEQSLLFFDNNSDVAGFLHR